MANRSDYIASELSKIVTQMLKNMAANKVKVSSANIKSHLLSDERFEDLIKYAMCGGEKSDLLRYVTPLKGFVAEASLKNVEDLVFNPDKGFDEAQKTLLNALSDHIISLERRQHKVSNFIEDVFTKFVGLQAELTSSFSNSIDFVEEDLALDQKLLGDAEDMHKVLKSENSIEYLRTKMLESFSNFVDTFGSKTESKKGRLDTINKEYTTVNSELEDYKKQVSKLQNDLNKYKTESITDHLTSLYNRKYMDIKMTEEIDRYRRMNTSFCIMLVDIDYFKNVNDNYGHLIGDQVLKHLAKLLKDSIRKTDFAFRYGGEEFLIMLTNVDVRNATHVAEQIRKKLKETNFSLKENSFNVTASFGIALFEKDDTQESVIKRADERLYKAKQTGRNKIVSS
ncbi:diguanylate cyclase [Denitrovibrio acetiphilus DSM 12809]|uniref:diguanylate cyclase n=1 Tax=Denitrovibrio acetiphilus (strain DSM 12809 / NBRC 114555 / N2460) TaxID=522772 RepID=D4H611_DENA2|nr:GGDEF domain-containing protein [Denitrovibrio acetiphilus]ADD67657.1 diguanylate cyclase [Denitrovibrio acetiphilus DSM 12809]